MPSENPWGLTPREVQVLSALRRLCSQKAVARELGLSVKTVEAHCYNARFRMGNSYEGTFAYVLAFDRWVQAGKPAHAVKAVE